MGEVEKGWEKTKKGASDAWDVLGDVGEVSLDYGEGMGKFMMLDFEGAAEKWTSDSQKWLKKTNIWDPDKLVEDVEVDLTSPSPEDMQRQARLSALQQFRSGSGAAGRGGRSVLSSNNQSRSNQQLMVGR